MGSLVKFLKRLAALPNGAEEARPNLILLVVCSAMFLDREFESDNTDSPTPLTHPGLSNL